MTCPGLLEVFPTGLGRSVQSLNRHNIAVPCCCKWHFIPSHVALRLVGSPLARHWHYGRGPERPGSRGDHHDHHDGGRGRAGPGASAYFALTTYFGLCHNPACSLQHFVVLSHVIACPAGARRAARGPGRAIAHPGPWATVRPAADGRAGPFRFRKERMIIRVR
jgi:hypothetical protein